MKVGFIGGKFLPLHAGHLSAIMQAKTYVDKLYVIVCWSKDEPFPMMQRKVWLGEELSNMEGIEIKTVENEFDADGLYNWGAGAVIIKALIEEPIDYIFSGEQSYDPIFKRLYPNTKHVIFDRTLCLVSGTVIRQDPYRWWKYLPKSVRSFFVLKVAVVGTESCGKSTLVKSLAKIYNTNYQSEIGREYCQNFSNILVPKVFETIAMHHALNINEKVKESNKILFIDSEAVTTQYYSEVYTQTSSKMIEEIINVQDFDLYLFLEPDVKWVGDGLRFLKDDRWKEFDKLRKMFDDRGIKYVTISGNYSGRLSEARDHVDQLEWRGV